MLGNIVAWAMFTFCVLFVLLTAFFHVADALYPMVIG